MSLVKHAIIAAAGMGTRIGLNYPKCLIEIAERPLIRHLLSLLQDVEDIRIIVGFEHERVMQMVKKIRDDVIFIMNPSYRTTTTLTSYVMGSEHLNEPCLYMDADIYFEPKSFARFLNRCNQSVEPLIGITKANTEYCVYTDIDDAGLVTSFSRDKESPYEWANLAWLPPTMLENKRVAVFEQLQAHLPIRGMPIQCYEIDTLSDYHKVKSILERKLIVDKEEI